MTNILHAWTANKKVDVNRGCSSVTLKVKDHDVEVIVVNLPKASRACVQRPERGELQKGKLKKKKTHMNNTSRTDSVCKVDFTDTDIAGSTLSHHISQARIFSWTFSPFSLSLNYYNLVAITTISQHVQREM